MKRLYQLLAQALEQDEVQPDDVLAHFAEWDSLAALTVVSAIDEQFGVMLDSDDLTQAQTAGDLERLVKARRPQGCVTL